MKLIVALTAAALLTAPSIAGPTCRDGKGKFTKCPPAAAAAAAPGVTKDSKGKCHIASGPKRGQFTKCPHQSSSAVTLPRRRCCERRALRAAE